MKRKLRIALAALCAGVLIFCLARLAAIALDYRKTDRLYADAAASFLTESAASPAPVPEAAPAAVTKDTQAEPEETPPPETGAPEIRTPDPGFTVDFDALRETNPDIIAWLYIEGTDISYPLLYGTDNSRYLSHAYDGSASNAGSIFLDYTASPDFSDLRSLIYGHRMNNGAMFGRLSDLDDADYLAEHSNVYLITPDGILLYRIFAVHYAFTWEGFYGNAVTPAGFSVLLREILAASDVDTGIVPDTEDHIITLSTCSGRAKTQRFLAHAVLLYDCRT